MTSSQRIVPYLCGFLAVFVMHGNAANPQKSVMVHHQETVQTHCTSVSIRCAKTVSAALADDGRIWFAWSNDNTLYVNYSDNLGETLSAPQAITQQPEKIAAHGENRPKIAIDNQNNIYVSWIMLREKQWTSDIRFSYSLDEGKTYSDPITINDDKLLTSHSFNAMQVDDTGLVSISWLDGRDALQAQALNQSYTGSAIYIAQATPRNNDTRFINQPVIHGSCVCCRLAMTLGVDRKPLIMWRHIYGDNFRDHALLTFDPLKKDISYQRVSFEHWQIDGCPHHGPTLVRSSRRIHMAWFNNAPAASGLFYAYTDDLGSHVSEVFHFSNMDEIPSHPQLSANHAGQINLVWLTFNGHDQAVKMIQSRDGVEWSPPVVIATAQGASDYPVLIQHPKTALLLWHKPGQTLTLQRINRRDN